MSAVLGLSLLLAALPEASHPAVAPQLAAYTATPTHVAQLMKSVRPYYDAVPSCTRGTAKRIELIVATPPVFDATGRPVSGLWKEVIKIDGCSTSGLVNVMTGFDSAGQVHVGALLPGRSIAGPGLQRDALQIIRSKLPPAPGCANKAVIDTSFDSYGSASQGVAPGRDPRLWTETWLVDACGTQTVTKVQFLPDATGTSIVATPQPPRTK